MDNLRLPVKAWWSNDFFNTSIAGSLLSQTDSRHSTRRSCILIIYSPILLIASRLFLQKEALYLSLKKKRLFTRGR